MVAAWRRSGQSAREYAARVGVSAASLHRWSSLVGSAAQPTTLVEVVASDASPRSWDWEVEVGAGTLRARGALGAGTAKAILEALWRAGRR